MIKDVTPVPHNGCRCGVGNGELYVCTEPITAVADKDITNYICIHSSDFDFE